MSSDSASPRNLKIDSKEEPTEADAADSIDSVDQGSNDHTKNSPTPTRGDKNLDYLFIFSLFIEPEASFDAERNEAATSHSPHQDAHSGAMRVAERQAVESSDDPENHIKGWETPPQVTNKP